MINCAIYRDE